MKKKGPKRGETEHLNKGQEFTFHPPATHKKMKMDARQFM